MTQPPPAPPAPTPAVPPASPATPPAGPVATSTRTRKFPPWMKNPQVMGGFALLLILAEIITFGVLGPVWFLIVNVVVWSVLWMALLAWRRRGRGGRGGFLATLLGRGRRTGGRGRGGASPGSPSGTGTRGRGLFRRSTSPSTGTGATGTRGRFGRLFGRSGAATVSSGGRGAGTGTSGRGSSASPSGGGWWSRRRRGGDASRSHTTRDSGVDKTRPKGKTLGRWARWFGVDPVSLGDRDPATAKKDKKDKRGDGDKGTPKPGKPAAGPAPGPGSAPEPRGSAPGREPWNNPDPEPVPAPRHHERRDRGSTHMPTNTDDASLHGWAEQLRGTEAAADAVRTRFVAAEGDAAEATTAATKARAIQAEASRAAHAAEAATAEDKPRLQTIARERHEAAQRAARVAADAAEAARKSADRALAGKATLAKDLKDLAAYGSGRLNRLADPAVVAHAETAARQAANADTSEDWAKVSVTTSEMFPIYLRRHGNDAARATDPRGGVQTEKLADTSYHNQGH
jgi:hypothetical protein